MHLHFCLSTIYEIYNFDIIKESIVEKSLDRMKKYLVEMLV